MGCVRYVRTHRGAHRSDLKPDHGKMEMQDLANQLLNDAQLAILSAESGHAEDIARDKTCERDLQHLGASFKRVTGCYEGSRENAFMVVLNEHIHANDVLCLARSFDQECVLFLGNAIHGYRDATLHFVESGEQEDIGRFQAVSAEYASELDAWTYDPGQDRYYAAL